MDSILSSPSTTAAPPPTSFALAPAQHPDHLRFLWTHCHRLLFLNGLLTALTLLSHLLARQTPGRRRRTPDSAPWKALLRALPLAGLCLILGFLIQHWTGVWSALAAAARRSQHVSRTWHWFRWFWLAMVGACGVPVVGLGVRAWKKGPGEERCAGGWVVVGVVGSAVCFGLAWLVTLDALLVVGEAGTQAGLGALDGAVFLVGLPGCPLLWMGVAFGGLACVLTDLDALAVWRAEGRERAEVELGGR